MEKDCYVRIGGAIRIDLTVNEYLAGDPIVKRVGVARFYRGLSKKKNLLELPSLTYPLHLLYAL